MKIKALNYKTGEKITFADVDGAMDFIKEFTDVWEDGVSISCIITAAKYHQVLCGQLWSFKGEGPEFTHRGEIVGQSFHNSMISGDLKVDEFNKLVRMSELPPVTDFVETRDHMYCNYRNGLEEMRHTIKDNITYEIINYTTGKQERIVGTSSAISRVSKLLPDTPFGIILESITAAANYRVPFTGYLWSFAFKSRNRNHVGRVARIGVLRSRGYGDIPNEIAFHKLSHSPYMVVKNFITEHLKSYAKEDCNGA